MSDARHDGAIVRRAATEAGRTRPEIVQYVPCVARPERDEARRAVIPPLAAMLTAFWSLGETRPARRAAMVGRSGIPDSGVCRRDRPAAQRRRCRAALDGRFVDAFAIAGTAEECLAQMAAYRVAGAGELALNFVGGEPALDVEYLGASLNP